MIDTEMRVGILASGDVESGGGGSTADKVARDALMGKVGFQVGVVICNNSKDRVGVYDKFDAINREFNLKGNNKIEVVTINSLTQTDKPLKKGQTTPNESIEICRTLEQYGVGFVATLGYMKILTGEFVEKWGWKPEYALADPTHGGRYHPNAAWMNNHPSILPHTAGKYGHGAHKKAWQLYVDGKITHTAMTFHLGTEGVDTGLIIREIPIAIEVYDDPDSINDKVQIVEKDETAKVIYDHLLLRSEHLKLAATA